MGLVSQALSEREAEIELVLITPPSFSKANFAYKNTS